MSTTSSSAALLPFQPSAMSPAQLSAVSYLARYTGATHALYSAQLRRWLGWCETNGLDPRIGIQRAHVELYIRRLGGDGLMDSSVNTMMHAVRGYFRFAYIDGTIPADPAVYARLPKVHRDECRTQGLDRLELIRFSCRSRRPSLCTTVRWPTCSGTTPCGPRRLLQCGSRTTRTFCVDIECCT